MERSNEDRSILFRPGVSPHLVFCLRHLQMNDEVLQDFSRNADGFNQVGHRWILAPRNCFSEVFDEPLRARHFLFGHIFSIQRKAVLALFFLIHPEAPTLPDCFGSSVV